MVKFPKMLDDVGPGCAATSFLPFLLRLRYICFHHGIIYDRETWGQYLDAEGVCGDYHASCCLVYV